MEQNGGATGGYEGGEDDRQLYVGNVRSISPRSPSFAHKTQIPFTVRWQELKDLFKEIGDVEFADIPRSNGHRSRGFGIVRFRTAEDAIKAVEKFNDFEWKGRKLAVRVDKMVTKRSGFTLFVGNLSWSVHWQDLKDFARDHGCPPARADVQFGYVVFYLVSLLCLQLFM